MGCEKRGLAARSDDDIGAGRRHAGALGHAGGDGVAQCRDAGDGGIAGVAGAGGAVQLGKAKLVAGGLVSLGGNRWACRDVVLADGQLQHVLARGAQLARAIEYAPAVAAAAQKAGDAG